MHSPQPLPIQPEHIVLSTRGEHARPPTMLEVGDDHEHPREGHPESEVGDHDEYERGFTSKSSVILFSYVELK